MAGSMAGSMAGKASSTAITRLSVPAVSTTIAPSAVCTGPRRKMPNQPIIAARSGPKVAGIESIFIWMFPSTDLKSLRIMIPTALAL
jgi:hypothetical protein